MERLVKLKQIRKVIESLPDAVVIVDRNGIINYTNSHIKELFGYTEAELVGKEIEVLIPERYRVRHKEHVKEYFKNPTRNVMSGHRSLKSLRKDGTEFEADVALAPITDGKAMFAFAGCRDITSKKSEEKELLEKTRQLEMVNQELEKYGYTISHDLKSPLQKIQALTDLMIAEIKEGRAENEIDTLSSFLKESVKSMETLISEVLDEAKAKAHREGKRGSFSPPAVCRT